MHRLPVAFVVVALLLGALSGLRAGGAAAAEGATRLIGGCAVEANPNSLDYTHCPRQNLRGAGLAGADLTSADFTSATLTGADLRRADLVSADLSGADLTGADLTGANLTGADLIGAILTNVTWSGTTCPDGSASDQMSRTCVDDLMVLEGAAVGANTTATPLRSPSQQHVSPTAQFDTLPLTGRPTVPMVLAGLDLVALGLVVLAVSGVGGWTRPFRRPSGV